MAKKTKRPAPVKDTPAGANPHAETRSAGRRLGNLLGGVCLLVYIIFKELWIGTLAFGLGFAVIWGLQVFLEKSHKWYTSPYFYASMITLALAYGEWQYAIISTLLNFK